MVVTKLLPPYEVVDEWLTYNPDTGKITWKKDRWYNAKAGEEAGAICTTTGYRSIRLGGKRKVQAHRVAWLLLHKEDPYPLEVDHIDGDRTNNKAANLRLVTRKQNQQNRTKQNKNNTTGYTGVYPRGKKWKAAIQFNGKLSYLGLFDTKEQASAAWQQAEAYRKSIAFSVES